MSQLQKLSKPFPEAFVHTKPGQGGGSYVEHSTVTQALLATLGPFTFRCKEIIRGEVAEGKTAKGEVRPALSQALVGVVGALTVTIDDREVTVEEVGDVGDPQNWAHDGQRGKDAMSDALKRCAMRLGCALHLWAQDEYFLDKSLAKAEEGTTDE